MGVGQADADQEYTEFVAARLGRLHRLAYLLTGDSHRADDVVAQALMGVYLKWRKVRASDNPDGYVRTMVVRAFLHERRRAWTARVVLTNETPERAAPPTEVEDASVLRAALDRLPPRQRAVLVLRFIEDLSVGEVAQLLGCSAGTVKSQTSHGLATLRRLLGDAAFAGIGPGRKEGHA